MLSQTKKSADRKTSRIIAVMLAAALMLACTACSTDTGGNSTNTPNSSTTTSSGDTASNVPDNKVTDSTSETSDTPAPDGFWLSDLLTDEEIEYNKNATPIQDFDILGNGFTDESAITKAYDIVFYNEKHLAVYIVYKYWGEAEEVKVPSYYFGDSAGYGFGYTDEDLNYHNYKNDSEIGGDFQRINAIANSAFISNTTITSVVLPNSITEIGEEAFKDCTNLTNITIPDSLLFVGKEAFVNTAWYNNQPEGLVYLGKGLLTCKGDYSVSDLTLSEGTSFIADEALQYNESLETITLPESCIAIGKNAFRKCATLKDIELGGVRSIGENAFRYCELIETVVIPDSCNYISSGAFSECSSLTSVYIPESVTTVGKNSFAGCDSITLYVHEGSAAHKYATENSITFELMNSVPDWVK